MRYKWLIPVLGIAAVIVAGVTMVKSVRAEGSTTYPPIMQKLAEKFNLNQDEVRAVFDEERQQRQAGRQRAAEERLNKAVSDGVINEAQKQALLEHQQQMQTNREEMQTWMEDSGIDFSKLHGYIGGDGPGRGGRDGHW